MNTFISIGLVAFETRLNEIQLLLDEANENFEGNNKIYNALCRSAQVLLCAHFEGYLKDLIKNALDDINQYSDFKSSNLFLKQRMCTYFIPHLNESKPAKQTINKINELIEIFDPLETKFKKEYFFYTDNENPKASVINKIASQFGINNFFKELSKSNLDIVFSNTDTENITKCKEIKDHLLEITKNFPFAKPLDFLGIDESKISHDNFWEVFLDGLLKRRHEIAHGTEINNSASHNEIKADKVKVEILVYVFTAFICEMANPVSTIID